MPTAIGGFHGMTFDHMRSLQSPYGHRVVLAVIAALCNTLYVRFKPARWL